MHCCRFKLLIMVTSLESDFAFLQATDWSHMCTGEPSQLPHRDQQCADKRIHLLGPPTSRSFPAWGRASFFSWPTFNDQGTLSKLHYKLQAKA